MLIKIKAKPNNQEEYVREIKDDELEVGVKAIAEKGKANIAVIKAISAYLKIPSSSIRIKTGFNSRHKIIEVKRGK